MEDEGEIFSNLPAPRSRRRDDDYDEPGARLNRAYRMMWQEEGPLRPRPSGVGGPSIGQGSTAPTGSTWSAADASANGMTLSNGGMTVTPSGAGSWQSIRSSAGKTSGKLYVEFSTSVAATAVNEVFGLASSGFNIANYLGSSNYSVGFALNGAGTVASSGFTSNINSSLTTPALNDVFAIAVDFTAGSIWFGRNNVWIGSGNPATGALPAASFVPATVGALFAGMTFQGAGCGVWTLQPTAASQKYLPPPGFQAWDGGPVTPSTSTWSAADASANPAGALTLSNAGLTVTSGNGIAWASIRGAVGRSSGKYYCELLAVNPKTTYNLFGLANASFNATTYLGNAASSCGVQNGNNGSQYVSGFVSNYGHNVSSSVVGDVVGYAVDFAAGSVWISLNNVWQNGSNPATGSLPIFSFVPATVGALFPALSCLSVSSAWTLQPTAASQTYAPPAGFSAWG